jgi:hypothetical protein
LQELNDFERNLGNAQIRATESMSFVQIAETPEETKARLAGTMEQANAAKIITNL